MMIAVAASCSYLTPLEPSCLMVYWAAATASWIFENWLRPTLLIYGVAITLGAAGLAAEVSFRRPSPSAANYSQNEDHMQTYAQSKP